MGTETVLFPTLDAPRHAALVERILAAWRRARHLIRCAVSR
jgi:hypothetical protein